MSPLLEKRLLQGAIALGGAFSLFVAIISITQGTAAIERDNVVNLGLDSHFRYLSGIFLGALIAMYSCVPEVERKGERLRLIGALIVCGGLARLIGVFAMGLPGWGHRYGLVMELIVTPLILLWQARVARRLGAGDVKRPVVS